jgi:hypothetical protein
VKSICADSKSSADKPNVLLVSANPEPPEPPGELVPVGEPPEPAVGLAPSFAGGLLVAGGVAGVGVSVRSNVRMTSVSWLP